MPGTLTNELSLQTRELIDSICIEAENRWQSGEQPVLEELLHSRDPAVQTELARELLRLEFHYRNVAGELIVLDDYLKRLPQYSQVLQDEFERIRHGQEVVSTQNSILVTSNVPKAGERHRLLPGEQFGRFRIDRLLGSGGFADVYLGHDQLLERPVALKIPTSQAFACVGEIDQYLAEARAIAKLQHSGIVSLFDVEKTATGDFALVMEYIDGPSLASQLKKGPISPRDTIRIVTELADTLHHAHQQDFVHRDLNPSNVLLSSDGKSHIADFGLAIHANTQRNRAGEFAGTLPYMSPEQVRGESHRCDGRTDIWAIGVILYEMLTGRRPFGGNEDQLKDEILNREPKPPRQIDPSISPKLEEICMRCLEKRISDRFTSASDVADALRTVYQVPENLNKTNAAETRYARSEQSVKRPALRRLLVTFAAMAVVVAAIAAVGTGSADRPDDDEKPAPVKPLFVDFRKISVGKLPPGWHANGTIAVQSRSNQVGAKLPGLGVSKGAGTATADFKYQLEGDFFLQVEFFVQKDAGVEIRLLSAKGSNLVIKASPLNDRKSGGFDRVKYSLNEFNGTSATRVEPFGSAHTLRLERRGGKYRMFDVADKGNNVLLAEIPDAAPFEDIQITMDDKVGMFNTVSRIYSLMLGPVETVTNFGEVRH